MAKKWYAGLFKENIYGFAIQAVTFLAGVLSTIIFPNILGKEGFGYFSIVIGVATIGVLLSDFGMPGALLRFIPDGLKRGVAWKYFRPLFAWKLLASFIAAAALFAFSDAIATAYRLPGLADGLRLGAAFALSYTMFGFFENTFIALKKTRTAFLMDCVFHSGRILLPIIFFIAFKVDYFAAIAGVTIACCAAVVFGWLLAGREAQLKKGPDAAIDYRALKSYIAFGTVGVLAYALSQWSDTLIIGLFRPVSDVSVYRVAWLWATATAFLFPFSQRIFFAAHAHEDEARSRAVFGLTLKYGFVFTFLMITGIFLVAAQFLSLLYGGAYNDSYPIMVVLSMLTIDLTLSVLTSGLLSGKGDIMTPTKINAVAGVAQAVLLFAAVPAYGMLGAAVVVVLVRIAAALTQTAFALRFISLRIPARQVYAPVLCGLGTVAVLMPLWQYSFSPLAAVIYGCAVVAVYSTLAIVLKAVDIRELANVVRGATS